jgi:hypothetical protein
MQRHSLGAQVADLEKRRENVSAKGIDHQNFPNLLPIRAGLGSIVEVEHSHELFFEREKKRKKNYL